MLGVQVRVIKYLCTSQICLQLRTCTTSSSLRNVTLALRVFRLLYMIQICYPHDHTLSISILSGVFYLSFRLKIRVQHAFMISFLCFLFVLQSISLFRVVVHLYLSVQLAHAAIHMMKKSFYVPKIGIGCLRGLRMFGQCKQGWIDHDMMVL
jgi:hypothetical protein